MRNDRFATGPDVGWSQHVGPFREGGSEASVHPIGWRAGANQRSVVRGGTQSSNPVPYSKESANHRFPRARHIDRRSDEATKPRNRSPIFARYYKFESISLQRRVHEPSVPARPYRFADGILTVSRC